MHFFLACILSLASMISSPSALSMQPARPKEKLRAVSHVALLLSALRALVSHSQLSENSTQNPSFLETVQTRVRKSESQTLRLISSEGHTFEIALGEIPILFAAIPEIQTALEDLIAINERPLEAIPLPFLNSASLYILTQTLEAIVYGSENIEDTIHGFLESLGASQILTLQRCFESLGSEPFLKLLSQFIEIDKSKKREKADNFVNVWDPYIRFSQDIQKITPQIHDAFKKSEVLLKDLRAKKTQKRNAYLQTIEYAESVLISKKNMFEKFLSNIQLLVDSCSTFQESKKILEFELIFGLDVDSGISSRIEILVPRIQSLIDRLAEEIRLESELDSSITKIKAKKAKTQSLAEFKDYTDIDRNYRNIFPALIAIFDQYKSQQQKSFENAMIFKIKSNTLGRVSGKERATYELKADLNLFLKTALEWQMQPEKIPASPFSASLKNLYAQFLTARAHILKHKIQGVQNEFHLDSHREFLEFFKITDQIQEILYIQSLAEFKTPEAQDSKTPSKSGDGYVYDDEDSISEEDALDEGLEAGPDFKDPIVKENSRQHRRIDSLTRAIRESTNQVSALSLAIFLDRQNRNQLVIALKSSQSQTEQQVKMVIGQVLRKIKHLLANRNKESLKAMIRENYLLAKSIKKKAENNPGLSDEQFKILSKSYSKARFDLDIAKLALTWEDSEFSMIREALSLPAIVLANPESFHPELLIAGYLKENGIKHSYIGSDIFNCVKCHIMLNGCTHKIKNTRRTIEIKGMNDQEDGLHYGSRGSFSHAFKSTLLPDWFLTLNSHVPYYLLSQIGKKAGGYDERRKQGLWLQKIHDLSESDDEDAN